MLCVDRDSWRMEDHLHFMLVFSSYIFCGVLPELEEKMWAHLVAAVTHYFTPVQYPSQREFLIAAAKARKHLFTFAELAERHNFPDSTFTINLHTLICRCIAAGSVCAPM